MTTEQIRPALTPEQWAAIDNGPGILFGETRIDTIGNFGEVLVAFQDDPQCVRLAHEAHVPLIAVLNESLDHDDPRKLVAADLEAINQAIRHLEGETQDDSARALYPIAAKLEALLPPR